MPNCTYTWKSRHLIGNMNTAAKRTESTGTRQPQNLFQNDAGVTVDVVYVITAKALAVSRMLHEYTSCPVCNVVNLCIHFGIPQNFSEVKKKMENQKKKVAQIFRNNKKKKSDVRSIKAFDFSAPKNVSCIFRFLNWHYHI